jgi:hypothetical protein
MTGTISPRWLLIGAVGAGIAWAGPAFATQVHAHPEGLYTHQIAHAFFAVSMGILIYWLRQRGLVKEPGWRLIQFAALFFILWNADAMVAHYLDDHGEHFKIVDAGTWHSAIQLAGGSDVLIVLYYLVKLDHLLCVPAIVLLTFGLRQLLRTAQEAKT